MRSLVQPLLAAASRAKSWRVPSASATGGAPAPKTVVRGLAAPGMPGERRPGVGMFIAPRRDLLAWLGRA